MTSKRDSRFLRQTFVKFVNLFILPCQLHAGLVWLGGVAVRDRKEPSLLEFGSVRVLPNIRVRSVRVLSSYGKIKVRFWFGSLCRVFGSVRFGSMRVLIHIYLVYIEYTVWVKKSTRGFVTFFPNSWEFVVQILRAYYFFLFTIDYKFLFSYLQLWRSHAILSATTRCA